MKTNTYIPPEAYECSACLQYLLAESDGFIDPGIDEEWGDL